MLVDLTLKFPWIVPVRHLRIEVRRMLNQEEDLYGSSDLVSRRGTKRNIGYVGKCGILILTICIEPTLNST
jgi:hypothetical protein